MKQQKSFIVVNQTLIHYKLRMNLKLIPTCQLLKLHVKCMDYFNRC